MTCSVAQENCHKWHKANSGNNACKWSEGSINVIYAETGCTYWYYHFIAPL